MRLPAWFGWLELGAATFVIWGRGPFHRKLKRWWPVYAMASAGVWVLGMVLDRHPLHRISQAAVQLAALAGFVVAGVLLVFVVGGWLLSAWERSKDGLLFSWRDTTSEWAQLSLIVWLDVREQLRHRRAP